MLKQKIPIDLDKVFKYSSIAAITLLIVSLIFRFRSLMIISEALIVILIFCLIIFATYSILEKYSPQKTTTKENSKNE